MSEPIKRFSPTNGEMTEDDNGDYVEYDFFNLNMIRADLRRQTEVSEIEADLRKVNEELRKAYVAARGFRAEIAELKGGHLEIMAGFNRTREKELSALARFLYDRDIGAAPGVGEKWVSTTLDEFESKKDEYLK